MSETKPRYSVSEAPWGFSIVETASGKTFCDDEMSEETLRRVCERLNALTEENERLREERDGIGEAVDGFGRMNDKLTARVEVLDLAVASAREIIKTRDARIEELEADMRALVDVLKRITRRRFWYTGTTASDPETVNRICGKWDRALDKRDEPAPRACVNCSESTPTPDDDLCVDCDQMRPHTKPAPEKGGE